MKTFEQFLLLIEAVLSNQNKNWIDNLTDRNQDWKTHFDFVNSKMKFDENMRASIPIEHDDHEDVAPPPLVRRHLAHHGYTIKNYLQGHVEKEGDKRPFNIGSILNKTNATPDIKKIYETDQNRTASQLKNHHIVFSMHPHDIGRMSTNQGWTSCLNPENPNAISGINDVVGSAINHGSMVAYLTHKDDKNLDKSHIDKYFNNPDISSKSKREEIHKFGSSHPNLTSAYQPYMQKYGNPNL